eukprot:12058498-Ditylum_brightwellii.AAC.1
MACIPHKSKAFKVLLDLLFNLREGDTEHTSVNNTTTKLAPPEAMAQLGLCMKRLATITDNYNHNRPFKFCKLDIKD